MSTPTSIPDAIPQLEPNLPAETFIEQDFWIPVFWSLGIALILATVGILLWLRYRRKPQLPPPDARQEALRALGKLEEHLPPLRPCSLQISLILRTFLTGQTHDPALYETHEEFSLRMDSLSSVPPNCQSDTRQLLEELAELKYAPENNDEPLRAKQLVNQAAELINRVADAQQQQAAEPSLPS